MLFFVCQFVVAQSSTDLPTHKWAFGMHLNVGIAPTGEHVPYYRDDSEFEEFMPSGFAGFTFSNNYGQTYFFETGLSYTTIASRFVRHILDTDPFELTTYFRINTTEYRDFLITLPLYVGLNYKRFVFKMGLKIGQSLYYTRYTSSAYSDSNFEEEYGKKWKVEKLAPLQNYQTGPAINVGFHLTDNFTVHIDAYRNLIAPEINSQLNLGLNYQFRKRN